MVGKKGGEVQRTLLPPVDVVTAQLVSALDKLPLRGGGKLSDYPAIADGNIRHLLVCRPKHHSAEIREYQTRHEIVGNSTTQKEIANFKRAAQKLLAATRALHAPARGALLLDPSPEQLSRWREHGRTPEIALELKLQLLILQTENYDMPELPKNAGRGRKAATQEANFALEIAKIYTFNTGKMPTIRTDLDSQMAYGPFLDFLTEIFDIFGLVDSPLVHARAAAKTMKEIGRKNSK